MSDGKYKQKGANNPVENHSTAAWSRIKKTKPVSNVAIPTGKAVSNSKEYVDGNEK